MAARLLSADAVAIYGLHLEAVNLIREKKDDMDQPTKEAIYEILLDSIQEIEEVMAIPTVRGHLDPNLRNPAVDENSSSYTPGPRAVYVQTPQRPAQPGHMPPPSLPHSSAPPPSAAKPACAPTPGGPPGNAKIEQLTEQWIRQNCVWESNCATPRGELYAAYVDDLRNQYHSLSGTLVSFCNQVKSIFSEVQFRMADNNLLMVVQGVRLNRPHKLAPSTFHTTPQPQSSASQAANNAAANTAIRDILKAVPPAVDPVPVPASSAPVSSTPIPATNGINGNTRIKSVYNSSWNSIFKRLRNQIKAVCILADMVHLGPAANHDESNALDQVKQTLRNISTNISPASSLRPSSTDTE